jgi:hypothetical protein
VLHRAREPKRETRASCGSEPVQGVARKSGGFDL